MFLLYLDAVSAVAEQRNGRGMPEGRGSAGATCEAVTCVTVSDTAFCHLKLCAYLRAPATRPRRTILQRLITHASVVCAQALPCALKRCDQCCHEIITTASSPALSRCRQRPRRG